MYMYKYEHQLVNKVIYLYACNSFFQFQFNASHQQKTGYEGEIIKNFFFTFL